MRVFLTGATGFIGSRVAARLKARGHDVVAFVRTPMSTAPLVACGCELLQGDVEDRAALRKGMQGADAVIHAAALYEIGIRVSERSRMIKTNVEGTQNVFDAAKAIGVPKTVYVSTINIFGNTNGESVDETYRRNEKAGFLSCYDESKYLAHEHARIYIQQGVPITIVQPGAVYGPKDHSAIGRQILLAARGKLFFKMMADLGLSMIHVDDVANGIVLGLENGVIGESYILSGENVRLGELLDQVSRVAGRQPVRRVISTTALRRMMPILNRIGPFFGYPPNLREVVHACDGVTYWVQSEKARNELGFEPRPLLLGLRETLRAEGIV